MAHISGNAWKLYYNATALTAPVTNASVKAASWTEDVEVQDLEVTRERGTTEYKTRGGTYETTNPLKRGMTFTIAVDTANAFYVALAAAVSAGTAIAVSEVNAAIATAGTKGLAGNWKVANLSEAHPVEGVTTANVTLAPVSGEVIEYVAPA